MVQAIILYRLETWVMYSHIGKKMGSCHNRVAHRLIEQQPSREQYKTLV